MPPIPEDFLSHPSNKYIVVNGDQTLLDALKILKREGGTQSWFLIADLGNEVYLTATFDKLNDRIKGESRDILYTPVEKLGNPLVPSTVIEQEEDLSTAINTLSESLSDVIIVTLVSVIIGIISLESLSGYAEQLPGYSIEEDDLDKLIEKHQIKITSDSEEVENLTQIAIDNKQHRIEQEKTFKNFNDNLRRFYQGIRKNPLVSILGFLILTLIPTIWIFTNQIWPALNPEQQVMNGEWNIAIAGFSNIGNESISREDLNLIGEVFYNRIEDELTSLTEKIDIIIQVRDPKETGIIRGKLPEERSANAEKLASEINADIIVYGTVEKKGNTFYLTPEFFIAIDNFYDAEEMVGQHALGKSIPIASENGRLHTQIEINRELSIRSQVLALMTQGLSLYFIHAYEEAYLMFSEANNENYWQTNKGREVVYLFQGNAAGKASMLDNAKEAYLSSLDIEPDYARAHAGLGSVYYLQSLDGVTSDNFQPEKTELNKAIKSYEEALLAEIQPPSADIPAKVAFGLAQVYLTQWFSGADTLNSAVSQFEFVVKQYNDGKNPRVQELAAESYGRFGLIARHDDHYDDAIIQFTKAIEISTIPNRRGLYWATLANLYEDRKETNKAYEANKNSIDEYTAALSLTTQENIKAKYLDNIATRYEHIGDITSAIDALNRAINLSPEGSEEQLIYEDRLNKLR